MMRLAEASLTFNFAKCEFAKGTVRYLGKEVGQGVLFKRKSWLFSNSHNPQQRKN